MDEGCRDRRADAAGEGTDHLAVRADGQGRLPACEVLINSPKISKHIERGEIKDIHDEIESSVSYFRMQTMNQSLIALLANGAITYDVAREKSLDPEDLSLKLRKLFPSIEEAQREGNMAPSPADFASIIELTDAQASLASAEANHVQSLVNYRVAVATLVRSPSCRRTRCTAPCPANVAAVTCCTGPSASSTAASSESCWVFEKRCTSSMNSTVGRPPRRRCARCSPSRRRRP